ncbi:zinc ribbon domain-containing protein [Flavonifractor sp. An92]|uniref:zinc ribbon domain-containing protein n=1 Tax=Flavonifractor sp. An92 TaxID=1965666 RepID=UPI000B365526|nr:MULTISPECIES: zinc ribbon domain-containing protein [unclassified Flavonifractor]OUN06803.1 zinc ribbon domain-containing protein [Flavonifractor sp. An92]OUQ26115.1 zinc ribbon domain-containing protein [Flavonifractor sp. An135]
MDERVKELLERVKATAVDLGEAAGTTARSAGKYAGQMVDVAKLNVKIFDLKNDVNDLLREVGQMVYDTHHGKEPSEGGMDELLQQLDEKNAAIDEVKERIAVLRNAKECPSCGNMCGRDDRFCKECGAQL